MNQGASHEALIWASAANDAAEDVLVAAGVEVLDESQQVKTEFRLLPIGTFTLRDGRGPYTIRDQAHAATIVADSLAFAGQQDMFIDYDHQLVFAAVPGVGGTAPAAGWIKALEARADGIWAVVDWTAKALEKLNDRAYRYISPLFRAKNDGSVSLLVNAGLVNQPAINGLGAIAASQTPTPKETEMKLTAIAAALGMAAPDSATEAQVIAAAQTLIGNHAALRQAVGAKDDDAQEVVIAAASSLKSAKVAGADDVIVPAAVWTDLQSQLAGLNEKSVEDLVAAGVADGKIVPATQASMLAWAKKDRTAFESYLKTAPVIVAAGQRLTGKAPAADETVNAARAHVRGLLGVEGGAH